MAAAPNSLSIYGISKWYWGVLSPCLQAGHLSKSLQSTLIQLIARSKSLIGKVPFNWYSLITCKRVETISSSNYSIDIEMLWCNPANPEYTSLIIADASLVYIL
jgi:hypothetical protein